MQQTLLPGVADPHGGVKAFTAAAAEQIFPVYMMGSWSFDPEVLATARAKGLSIREVPIRWENDERSKARIWQLPQEFQAVYCISKQLRHAETKAERRLH